MSKPSNAVTYRYVKKTYDSILFRIRKGGKATIVAHAQAQGESTNAFIVRAITETMERDTITRNDTSSNKEQ